MKYKDSGVDIERAKRAKDAMTKHVKATWGPDVLSETGAFGGLYSLGHRCEDPVLVSSIDGVGTKLIVARMAGRYDTIGQDLVNHCVNDILVQGARPLFFLDYIASASLEPEVIGSIIEGMSAACKTHGCALIGGETAELPDVYQEREFDLAGCIVGVVERQKIIDGTKIQPGDRVLALASNGLHTNGYSLVRNIAFGVLGLGVDDFVEELGCKLGEELLRIHASYFEAFGRISEVAEVKGMAHITGGGIVDNLSRVLPGTCNATIREGSWPVPKVFEFLQRGGAVGDEEMYRVFNMGLGMIVIVAAKDQDKITGSLRGVVDVHSVGEIVKGTGKVKLS